MLMAFSGATAYLDFKPFFVDAIHPYEDKRGIDKLLQILDGIYEGKNVRISDISIGECFTSKNEIVEKWYNLTKDEYTRFLERSTDLLENREEYVRIMNDESDGRAQQLKDRYSLYEYDFKSKTTRYNEAKAAFDLICEDPNTRLKEIIKVANLPPRFEYPLIYAERAQDSFIKHLNHHANK
jgi:hypothetical protein